MIKIKPIEKQIILVKVQDDLVPAEYQVVRALAMLIRKYGDNGVLRITQDEAVKLLAQSYRLSIEYNFENNALELKCHDR